MSAKLKTLALISGILIVSLSMCYGEKLGIHLGYPYLGVKYSISPKFAIEPRVAYGEDILAVGLREYYTFNPDAKFKIFTSLEGYGVFFKTKLQEGSGYTIGLYGGFTYSVLKNVAVNIDLGAVFINLTGKLDTKVSGVEIVSNAGIIVYIF